MCLTCVLRLVRAPLQARAWEEEAAMGEDMIVEDQREEEVRQAVKATKELLSECRYRENVLKMEKEKVTLSGDGDRLCSAAFAVTVAVTVDFLP